MNLKALKNAEKKSVVLEKKVSQLEQRLELEKAKLKKEKQKNKSLTDKLSRRDSSRSELKEELSTLKKTFNPKY